MTNDEGLMTKEPRKINFDKCHDAIESNYRFL